MRRDDQGEVRVPDPGDGAEQVRIVPGAGLVQPASQRFVAVWRILGAWTRRDLRVRYRQSVLNAGWGLIQPITLLAIYGWVVTAVLDVGQEELPYLSFAWAGIVPFTFVSQALGQGVGSIQSAGALISRVYFPREVLPLAVVAASIVDLGIMTAILIMVRWVQIGTPTVHLAGLLLVDLMLIVWTAALTLWAATVTVFRRDLNYAVPLLLRVLFIVSPVVYSADLLRSRSWAIWGLNPLSVAIEGTRDAALRGEWPDVTLIGAHLLAGLTLLTLAGVIFRRLEPRMGDFV
jgi:lipopolysaccharide transport system permease protein